MKLEDIEKLGLRVGDPIEIVYRDRNRSDLTLIKIGYYSLIDNKDPKTNQSLYGDETLLCLVNLLEEKKEPHNRGEGIGINFIDKINRLQKEMTPEESKYFKHSNHQF